MYYLLLDTNIYLHYHFFETVPWDRVIGEEGPFTILLPMQVLREIEKIKDQGVGAVSKRARKVSSRLGDILLDGAVSSVALETCEMPPISSFSEGFSADIDDDVILMSGIHFIKDKEDKLIVIGGDGPFLIKAKQAGLAFVRMPKEYELAGSMSKEEKEKKKLEEELAMLKNRMPKPYVAFKDKSTLVKLKRVTPCEPTVDQDLSDDVYTYLFHQEEKRISRERFHSIMLYVFNDGKAPTGEYTVVLNSAKLKTCKIDLDDVTDDIPDSLLTEEDKNRDWGYCEPFRTFVIYRLSESKQEDEVFEASFESLTQGRNHWVREYEVDLWNAKSGSIDWEIYDPALPEPVKGTLRVVVE